jgi:hypothetical protein
MGPFSTDPAAFVCQPISALLRKRPNIALPQNDVMGQKARWTEPFDPAALKGCSPETALERTNYTVCATSNLFD